MHHLLAYAAAAAAMFATTLLRSFQNKSVAAGHKKLVFFVGGLMTAFEGFVFVLISKQGGDVVWFTAAGSACGWVTGMYVHDAIMRKRRKQAKQLKKSKKRAQIEDMVDERVQEKLKELGVI